MAYGVNKPNPGGGSVAPKVQGTSMAPRQQAVGRALGKPKPEPKGPQFTQNQPKSPNFNTAFGVNQQGGVKGGNQYNINKNDGKPGFDVNGNQVTNPAMPTLNQYGVPQQAGPGGGPGGAPLSELDQYLAGDDIYQSILSEIQRNKELSNATYETNKANYNTDAETIKRRLGIKEVEDNALLDNDYAARGLFGSGLFAKADTDLGTSYSNQYTDLATTLQRNLQQLDTDRQSQDALDSQTQRQAEQDAITRRAQEYGIFGGPSAVDPTKPSKGGGKNNKKDDKKDTKPGKGGKGGKK